MIEPYFLGRADLDIKIEVFEKLSHFLGGVEILFLALVIGEGLNAELLLFAFFHLINLN